MNLRKSKAIIVCSRHVGQARLDGRCGPAYPCGMMRVIAPDEKLAEDGPVAEVGYDAWARAKIERGMAQARDRDAMIPVEQVLRDLSLDR